MFLCLDSSRNWSYLVSAVVQSLQTNWLGHRSVKLGYVSSKPYFILLGSLIFFKKKKRWFNMFRSLPRLPHCQGSHLRGSEIHSSVLWRQEQVGLEHVASEKEMLACPGWEAELWRELYGAVGFHLMDVSGLPSFTVIAGPGSWLSLEINLF